jgi:O-antigen/teichoic acid export membrane protein
VIKKIKLIRTSLDVNTLEVVKKSSSSLIVKMIGLIAGFGISIVLGRNIGPEGLGIINLATRIIDLILIFTLFGMDNVIRKEIAIAFERKDWQHIANTIYTSLRLNIPFALLISIILIFVAPWVSEYLFNETKLTVPLTIFIVLLVPQVFSRILASGINGFRKIWQSNLVDATFSYLVTLLGLSILLLNDIRITIINTAIIYGIGRLSTSLIIGLYWRYLFRFKDLKRVMLTKPMLKVALPLLIVSSTSLIASSADTVMLALMSDISEVGLYNVALRLGMMTSILHVITMSSLTPKVASFYHENKIIALQTMVQKITLGLGAIGLISLIIFILFGDYFLSFWGSEFEEAYWILILIASAQFINISSGATGTILIMTGNEKVVGYLTSFTALLNIFLNFILIPKFGGLGAAIGTGATLIIQNIIQFILVKRKVGIYTIEFKSIKK